MQGERVLENILSKLSDIANRLGEKTGYQQANTPSEYDIRREEQQKRSREPVKQQKAEVTSPTLTGNENTRYSNIAKAFNKIFKVDEISKSVNKLREYNELKDKESARKALVSAVGTIVPTQPIKEAEKNRSIDRDNKKNTSLLKWLSILSGLGAAFSLLTNLNSFSGLIQGATKWLTIGTIKIAAANVKLLFNIVKKPFQMLESLFASTAIKEITKASSGKFTTKVLQDSVPKIFKFLGKSLRSLKVIPVIGSLISFYFAWDRFKQGDITGGLLEVASGLANLIPIPMIGTALSIGIDAINVFRDFSGKTANEIKQNKSGNNWLLNKFKSVGEFIYNNYDKWPVIGSLVRSFKHFKEGTWDGIKQGLISLGYVVPPIGTILEFLEISETDSTGQAIKTPSFGVLDAFKKAASWISQKIKDNCLEWPVIGSLIKAGNAFNSGRWEDGIKSLGLGWVVDLYNQIPSPSSLFEPITVTASTIKDGISSVANNIKDKLMDMLGPGFRDIVNGNVKAGIIKMLPKSLSKLLESPKTTLPKIQASPTDLKSLAAPNTSTLPIKDSLPDIDLSILNELKESVGAMDKQKLSALQEQTIILRDTRSIMSSILNSINSLKNINMGTSLSDNVPDFKYSEHISSTRRDYIDSMNMLGTAIRGAIS